MKLIISGEEFLLDNCNKDIQNGLQEEFDNIVFLANMIDYEVRYSYNTFFGKMCCYFFKNNGKGVNHYYTLIFEKNKNDQFTQYYIYSTGVKSKDFKTIYRKRNSKSFWRVLKNFKRML